ncbi:stage II sporulation protein M [Flavobacterium sp. CBA20B-1]|uniref:stage II sporulation protein M n=1 Tax=unclassified Flavobacterium TaxID=196869 RepID=UPI002224EFCC|nr:MULTISPECIES: stage II sporulation protein M [unclassified Flavobacterium]WCM42650.1 stage II sporulation protein M [Flavobacterium sp. CBA20B-1]
MREIAFIKQNKEKWLNIEQQLTIKNKISADNWSNMYVQLSNDLAFAQTYFPKSDLTAYLNNLASTVHQKVYTNYRYEKGVLNAFFFYDVPLIAYKYRKVMYFALILFLVFVTIGAVSAAVDERYVRLILGDAYVNQTLENISKGDAMAVYKSSSNWGSAFGITINNLYVGVRCYIYGIFLGLGTFYIMVQNAVMLGSFQYFFYEKGVFSESIRGIWLHGAMEIMAIVIEVAAGFMLGASLLFPGTYTRMQSLKIGFKNSFKLFISTMPFTIFAGLIEGYITRYAKEMPNVLNYLIIGSTLALITFYYFIYPVLIHKKTLKNL